MASRVIPFVCTVVALVPTQSSFSPFASRHLRPSQRSSVFSDWGISLCPVLRLVECCRHAPECNRKKAQVLAQLKAVSQRQTVFSQFCGCKCCGTFGVVCTVVGAFKGSGGAGGPIDKQVCYSLNFLPSASPTHCFSAMSVHVSHSQAYSVLRIFLHHSFRAISDHLSGRLYSPTVGCCRHAPQMKPQLGPGSNPDQSAFSALERFLLVLRL
ncbi:hypothetical protein NDU88_006741 [Pleurodeles waltl]|uniref:Secreted protein n=1 Tax=Pleurodeles waltl TaxID=8319 RepID=A0AAV7WZ41_PLEWA|nr:hypothetical protein NDU88_006741 [Pleurodeles waltl]